MIGKTGRTRQGSEAWLAGHVQDGPEHMQDGPEHSGKREGENVMRQAGARNSLTFYAVLTSGSLVIRLAF